MAAVTCLRYQTTNFNLFWNEIIKSFFGYNEIENEESILLTELKINLKWITIIPLEWQEVYGHLYDNIGNIILLKNELFKIEKDIYRTFSIFIKDTKIGQFGLKLIERHYCDSLRYLLILLTYHMGYTQGMNYIVALVLLIEPSIRNCYIILTYLFYHNHLSLLFNTKTSCLSQYIKIFDKKFQLTYPILHHHLQENGFFCYCYTVDWFTTFFIRTAPGELSLHIIELLLVGVKDILIRVGLSIMHLLHDKLLKLEEDELHLHFRNMVRSLSPKDVIVNALKIKLNPKKKVDIEENIIQTLYVNLQLQEDAKKASEMTGTPTTSTISTTTSTISTTTSISTTTNSSSPSSSSSLPIVTTDSIDTSTITTTTTTISTSSNTSILQPKIATESAPLTTTSLPSRVYPPLPRYPPLPCDLPTYVNFDNQRGAGIGVSQISDAVARIFNEKRAYIASIREKRLQQRNQQKNQSQSQSQSQIESETKDGNSETSTSEKKQSIQQEELQKPPYLSPIQRLVQSLPPFDHMLRSFNSSSDNTFHEEIIRRILLTNNEHEDGNENSFDENNFDENNGYHTEIENIDNAVRELSIVEIENELREDLLKVLRESSEDENILDSNTSLKEPG